VDSKAEYSALPSTCNQKKKLKQTKVLEIRKDAWKYLKVLEFKSSK